MSIIVPVILSGGSGTRLWPVSTGSAPKQFQPLTGSGSMFLQTLDRAVDRDRFAAPLIVCGPAHVAHVEADLAAAGVTDARIIVEPAGFLHGGAAAEVEMPGCGRGGAGAPAAAFDGDNRSARVAGLDRGARARHPASDDDDIRRLIP